MGHAKIGRLDVNRRILHYGYVTPGYIIGSAILHPNSEVATFQLSRMGRWLGAIFADDADGRIFPDVAKVFRANGQEDSLDEDNFFAVQDRNLLIVQKNWRLRDQPSYTMRTRIYFSPTLDEIVEDSCWIFAREGAAYAAVRVAGASRGCGHYWPAAPQRASNATSKNANFAYLSDPQGMAPIVMALAESDDYDNDFSRFRQAIKNQVVHYGKDEISFATVTMRLARKDSDGIYLPPPRQPTDKISPEFVTESPLIRSTEPGLIYLRNGETMEVLDFRDLHRPVRTDASQAASGFPAGTGTTAAIKF